MLSDPHETGYRRLEETLAAAREALAKNDYELIPGILKTQEEIMAGLAQAGECTDTALLPMILRLKDEMDAVAREIELKRDGLREEMSIAANKRKIAVYGDSVGSRQ